MKTRALLSIFLLFSVLLSFGQADSTAFSGTSDRKNIPDYIKNRKAYKRAEWFNVQRSFPYDTIPRTRYAQEMDREIKKVQTSAKNGDAGLTWSSVGPQGIQSPYTNWGKVSGRVRAIAVHPADPLIIYIGAASGGIWKTNDGGQTWLDIGHGLESLSFGAIAIDPNNPETIYAGSGECSYLQGFIGFDGKGIFKSTDGGATWTRITNGIGPITNFGDLAVSPYNSNLVIGAMASGYFFSGDLPNEGIWRSSDAGLSWTRTLDVQDAYDIAYHPTDANRVYAAVGGGNNNAGFYISNNQGISWLKSNLGLPPGSSMHRIQIDVSQSNPNMIYAVIFNLNTMSTSAYKSVNGGTSWAQISAGTNLGGFDGSGWYDQGFYDLCIAVDPENPNHVLIGNVELHRTTNGSNFSPVRPFGSDLWGSLVHNDYHKLVFAPSNPDYLYIGCDGGFYQSTDKGYTASSRNQGLETLQFYRIASHPSNSQILFGGMQDNANAISWNGGTTWTMKPSGDGMECFFNHNPDTVYSSAQCGYLFRSTNGGASFSYLNNVNGAWITPLFMHPVNHKTLYSANKSILKSTNAGASFFVIAANVSQEFINTMAQSQVNPNNMIFAAGCTQAPVPGDIIVVKVSTNGGTIWIDVTDHIPGESRWISRVVTDPVDDSAMYVLRTGFSPGNKVWKSADLGQTWTNISGDLPDLPCNDLFIDPENTHHLYVANDIGVYSSTDGGATWTYASEGIPFVPGMDFDYVNINSTRYLRVGTFGRSIYETTLPHYCLPEGITFTTQEQIDNFSTNYPGCTEIEGDVAINGSGINNLNGLSILTSIGGDLWINNNDALTSLTGLDNVNSIGGNVWISFSSALSSLTGLEGLTSIGGSLEIILCNALNSIAGLNALTTIGGKMEVTENNALTSLTGLNALTSIGGSLSIYGNDALTSLTGLDNLTFIGGDLAIGPLLDDGGSSSVNRNSALTSLTGLNSLTSIGGNLSIYGNDALTSLTGLENLNSIGGNLEIGIFYWGVLYGNPALTSISALATIDAGTINSWTIAGNESLSTCSVQSLCNYLTSPNGSVNIYSNAPGCNNPAEVASDCGISLPCLPFGNYYLLSQADIDNFQVNYPGCTELAGDVEISGSDITHLDGLSNLTSIGEDLSIYGDSSLTDLTGLTSLTSLGGSLIIYSNNSLTSLSGLDGLNSIGGYTAIGIRRGMSVYGNPNLTNITGLENIEAGSVGNLQILGNHSLSDCAINSICDYLAIPGSNPWIEGNAPGCNSPEEVQAACETHCLPEGITFTTQNQVDSFQVNHPGCTEIEGDVTINGSGINNLNGLSVITSVGGSVDIYYTSLINLTGLDSLTSIGGDLLIAFNSNMTSVTGLENLTSLKADLKIFGNENLTSLTGLENLTTIEGSLILADCPPEDPCTGNPSLNYLTGLDNLHRIGANLIIVASSLINLSGLENLTSVGGHLAIYGNYALVDLEGMNNLDSIGGTLQIGDYGSPYHGGGNPSLTSLSGLEGVTFIAGSLNIVMNTALTSLSGLDHVEAASISNLSIWGNYALSTCDVLSICDYLASPTGFVSIANNAPGCNSPEEVLAACETSCLPEGITFTTQSQIDNFQTNYPGCTEIEGTVQIGEPYATTDITNLNGLSVLNAIGDSLFIINNPLTSLAGLENLNYIGGSLIIGHKYWGCQGNNALVNLAGLNGLDSIGGDLDIDCNQGLTSLAGLEGLHSIGGNLFIGRAPTPIEGSGLDGGNPSLISLSGLNNLTSVGGYIFIGGNGALSSLTGLEGVSSLNGWVGIKRNGSLINLDGLNNLNYIGGGLSVYENSHLVNLSGLDNLDSISGGLYIGYCYEAGMGIPGGNASLTSLHGLENLTRIGGTLNIGHNPSLASLAGLENIVAGSITNLEICSDSSLSICEVQSVCDYLAAPNGEIHIGNNAPGCNSPEEVLAACAVSVEDIVSADQYSLFPNPADKSVSISSKNGGLIEEVVIFNQTGQKVLQGKTVNNNLDISKLPPGMYVVELGAGQWKARKKLMVE